jgi:hypothetical protein
VTAVKKMKRRRSKKKPVRHEKFESPAAVLVQHLMYK